MSSAEPLTIDDSSTGPRSAPEPAAAPLEVAVLLARDRNPYAELLYEALAVQGIERVDDVRLDAPWLWLHRRRIQFLHFHWDQCFSESVSLNPRFRELRSWFKTARYALLLALARMLRYRIIWTVHEVLPHEGRSLRRDLVAGRILAKASHALVAHDDDTAVRAAALLRPSNRRIAVIPHGSYDGVYPAGRSRDAVRDELEVTASNFVFLAFGNLRRYKRIDLLLDAFSAVEDPDAVLVIAGEFLWRLPDPDWTAAMRERLQDAAASDRRIRCRIGRVPTDGVSELHAACDAAVSARSDGWTSGSMILALSEGLPVIAARQPAYVELLGDDCGWFYEPGSAQSLAGAMTAAAADPTARAKRAPARRRAAALDWQTAASGTAALMLSTLPRERRLRADGRG